MPNARRLVVALSVSLVIALGAAPAAAAVSMEVSDGIASMLDGEGRPFAGARVDVISADGTFARRATTDPSGGICLIAEGAAAPPGRADCIVLPEGEYRVFVGEEQPIRISVAAGAVRPSGQEAEPAAEEKPRSRTALWAGAAVLAVAGLAGGGGGGGSSDDEPNEPVDVVSVSVTPQMLTGSFELGTSPCPTTIGDLSVENTGDIAARVTVVPIEGISTTGQGQSVEPGDSATVTVLYNCLVVAAIAGTIEVGLTADGQSDSDTIEILVDFQ
ncbi:MAG: hypothetical protein M5U09_20975 [Gammaproteobacteria bacterium]|nr:hypothetical protein [Gammaproteobacteria bacterium]